MKNFFSILALLAIASNWSTMGQEITTGPAPGTQLTPVMAYGAGGVHKGSYDGREFDAVAEIGTGPGALLFVHEITRNILPLIRELDTAAAEFSVLSFKSFSLLLHADRSEAENRLKAMNGSIKMRNPMLLSLDGAEGPGNYALNRKAVLSLILVNHGKVVRSIAFTDVNQKDAESLHGWIEELTGPIPKEPAEYRKLVDARLPTDTASLREIALNQAAEIQQLTERLRRQQQQSYNMRQNRMADNPNPRMTREAQRSEGSTAAGAKPDEPSQANRSNGAAQVRQGKPPEDPELNSLLRSFIRKTNDDERNDSIFSDIQKRASESEALNAEAVEMFKLMLSFRNNYGTPHAQQRAEAFLKEHAGKP